MSNNKSTASEQRNRIGFWARLWRRPWSKLLLGIPAGGLIAVLVGIVMTGGFMKTIEATNSLEFCTSCHEMQAFVYQEYKQTTHYNNASGVRAICADCHVPKAFFPKILRKTKATFKELPAHLMGKIDTKEEFESHRAELARSVWDTMNANNSKSCRTCHSYDAMSEEVQDRYARRRHSLEYREATGKTCIDCHKGVAHKLPEDM